MAGRALKKNYSSLFLWRIDGASTVGTDELLGYYLYFFALF